MQIRTAHPDDIPALKTLWEARFGDGRNYIDSFFSACFTPERTLTAMDPEGRLCGACYLLPCGLITRDALQRADMLYALAVQRDLEGQGIGSLLLDAAKVRASRQHAALILSPATPSLAGYYARRGFRAVYYRKDREIPCPQGRPLTGIRPCDAALYTRLRDARYHAPGTVRWDAHAIAWALTDHTHGGGECITFDLDGTRGAVLCRKQENTLHVTETTFPPALECCAILAACRHAGCTRAVFHDAQVHEGTVYGMVYGSDLREGYFNLALD